MILWNTYGIKRIRALVWILLGLCIFTHSTPRYWWDKNSFWRWGGCVQKIVQLPSACSLQPVSLFGCWSQPNPGCYDQRSGRNGYARALLGWSKNASFDHHSSSSVRFLRPELRYSCFGWTYKCLGHREHWCSCSQSCRVCMPCFSVWIFLIRSTTVSSTNEKVTRISSSSSSRTTRISFESLVKATWWNIIGMINQTVSAACLKFLSALGAFLEILDRNLWSNDSDSGNATERSRTAGPWPKVWLVREGHRPFWTIHFTIDKPLGGTCTYFFTQQY